MTGGHWNRYFAAVAGALLFWNKEVRANERRCIMTVLEKIKSFFRRAKPVAKRLEERPPEAGEEKPPIAAEEKPPEGTGEKTSTTTGPQKEGT